MEKTVYRHVKKMPLWQKSLRSTYKVKPNVLLLSRIAMEITKTKTKEEEDKGSSEVA
jgi:hypothetical protein